MAFISLFYSQIVPVAIPVGATPTGILVITVFVAISITETVLLAWFVTYARVPFYRKTIVF